MSPRPKGNTGATDTLNRITLPLFGQDRSTVAMEWLRENERIAALNDLDRQIELTALADPQAADELAELRYTNVP